MWRSAIRSRAGRLAELARLPIRRAVRLASPLWMGERPAIRQLEARGAATDVETYWGRHTVPTLAYWTRGASLRQLERRFDQYPLFRELSGHWGEHDGEVILDYGCGPGNDLVGFALNTAARSIIGIDVSAPALWIAADRLALHRIEPSRIELILAPEGESAVPLADESVDHMQSQGVLHHTSDPEALLAELRRVLRPGGSGCVMVYNRDSVWLHLYVAYQQMVAGGRYPELSVEEAFARTTDGEECPIARCYRGAEFAAICEAAGFEATYLGGYFSRLELSLLGDTLERALADPRLGDEHQDFLRRLSFDRDGYPLYEGKHAGIGGTYRLRRPRSRN